MRVRESFCCYTDLGKRRISYEVTSSCPFKCPYCFRNRTREMEFSLVREKLDVLREFSDDILVTGGEPMIWPHIDEFLALLKEYSFTVAVSTSGYLLEKHLEALVSTNLRSVNLSLDSVDPGVNDGIRGRGAHAWFTKALDLLSDRTGFRVKVQVTVTPSSLLTLRDTLDFLLSQDRVDYVVVAAPFPSSLPLEAREVVEDMADPRLSIYDPQSSTGSCLVGKMIHIRPDGSIHPCALCPLRLGHLSSGIPDIMLTPPVNRCPAVGGSAGCKDLVR